MPVPSASDRLRPEAITTVSIVRIVPARLWRFAAGHFGLRRSGHRSAINQAAGMCRMIPKSMSST
jgi:hypothetical protein